jgi:uncharacterized protein (TIGR00106 family)
MPPDAPRPETGILSPGGGDDLARAEVSVVPVGTHDPSYAPFVEAAVGACAAEGLSPDVGALSTLLEGDVDQILRCARRMHRAVLEAGAERVITHVTLEERVHRPRP